MLCPYRPGRILRWTHLRIGNESSMMTSKISIGVTKGLLIWEFGDSTDSEPNQATLK